jgi:hypothetical protein
MARLMKRYVEGSKLVVETGLRAGRRSFSPLSMSLCSSWSTCPVFRTVSDGMQI